MGKKSLVLKDLGLNVDTMRDEIITSAAKGLQEEFSREIKTVILKQTEKEIVKKVSELVEETVREIYQPVDDYGQLKGEPTTLRDAFKDASRDWWNVKITKEGGVPGYSADGKARHERVAKKILEEIFDEETQGDFQRLVETSKELFKDAIAKQIKIAVESVWGKQ